MYVHIKSLNFLFMLSNVTDAALTKLLTTRESRTTVYVSSLIINALTSYAHLQLYGRF